MLFRLEIAADMTSYVEILENHCALAKRRKATDVRFDQVKKSFSFCNTLSENDKLSVYCCVLICSEN